MPCGCPQNYIFNETTGLCERIFITPATLTVSPFLPLPICINGDNMQLGTVIYPIINKSQYPLIGTDDVSPGFEDVLGNIILPDVNLIVGDLWTSNGDLDKGRFNQAGIGLLPPVNQWQGYSRCITIEDGDEISIALSATYGFRLYIDGELAIFYLPQLPAVVSDYLYVFPLNLSVGEHNLLFEGFSGYTTDECFDENGFLVDCRSDKAIFVKSNCSSLGSFICEIYKNVTAQILSNIFDQNGLNSIYADRVVNGILENITTILLKGSPTDTGIHGNYNCNSGYITNCIPGKFYCIDKQTISPGACCFILTNCVTGVVTFTTTDLTEHLGRVIKVYELNGCQLINISDSNCSSSINVTVASNYSSCEECGLIYYNLVDCKGKLPTLVTTINLTEYIGKIVKIEGYSNVCWIITHGNYSISLITPEILGSFNTCEQCL